MTGAAAWSIARLQYSGGRKDQCRQSIFSRQTLAADAKPYGKAWPCAILNHIRACRCPPLDASGFEPLSVSRSFSACRRCRVSARYGPPRATLIAMHGAPAMPADFTHMPYANPDAPKGGRLVESLLGTFDSLQPSDRPGAPPCNRSGAFHSNEAWCSGKPDGTGQQ